jgi:hypothetical protein
LSRWKAQAGRWWCRPRVAAACSPRSPAESLLRGCVLVGCAFACRASAGRCGGCWQPFRRCFGCDGVWLLNWALRLQKKVASD